MRDGLGGWHIQTFFDVQSDIVALSKARDFRDLKRVSKNRDADYQRIESSTHNKSVLTVGDLLRKYKEEITPDKKDVRTETNRIDMLLKTNMANLPAHRVDGEVLRKELSRMTWRGEGNRQLSDSTRVRYQTLISHVYNIARRRWRHKLENPVLDMDRFTNNPGRDRRLIDGEFDYLYAALLGTTKRANLELQPIFLLALGTGCREDETLTHSWEDIDWEHTSIHVSGERAKNGKDRSVPVFQMYAVDALIQLHEDAGKPKHGKIFRTTQNALIQAWNRAVSNARTTYLADCERAGQKASDKFLVDLNFHDLRHEATSFLFESTDLKDLEIMQILGHQDLQTTKKYAHLRSKKLGKRILEQA
jgi:integrase